MYNVQRTRKLATHILCRLCLRLLATFFFQDKKKPKGKQKGLVSTPTHHLDPLVGERDSNLTEL